jgi:glycosyltransferase involved in cell wall biosynthesis
MNEPSHTRKQDHTVVEFGAVAIGRNEGERLMRCLASLAAAIKVVYVDSASTDGSVQWASKSGFEVLELDAQRPFTAARARNAGFQRLRQVAPRLSYVQFVDGDCELVSGWPEKAISFLNSHPNVAAVCGRRRERFPERSIYNWLCDQEWDGPVGEVCACGGDVMMRSDALIAMGGYRDDLIAGEEPELCVRLRAAKWRIWRLAFNMTLHDAAMLNFHQWWKRAVRAGYAFAQGAHLHGAPPERHYVWESRRAWLWGVFLPLACLATVVTFGVWGSMILLVYPLQFLRQVLRNSGGINDRATLALFQILARFPEAFGQMRFFGERLFRRHVTLVEYK